MPLFRTPKKKQQHGKHHQQQSQVISSIHEFPVDPDNPDYMQEDVVRDGSEGGQNDQHKSVILHLISQLKIGMDLTKVTLPTFILEKRSLLEFYADLFAYPHLFVDIAKQPSGEERMVACVRFYLSTFSAGRESSLCKKPYNPILGEYFRCSYKIDAAASSATFDPHPKPVGYTPRGNDSSNSDDPLYWSGTDELSFIGEQVSHHPPVSACYCLNRHLGIVYEGHVWTKSKFYGLSVGVEMIGPGSITLLEHDEKYELIYPNVMCRSILTIPWSELVGDTYISCSKTGYSAKIKFHAKPFYRGHANRVTAEIFSDKSGKIPVCTIEGRWDGVLHIHYPNQEKKVFFDRTNVVRGKKRVLKLDSQDELESRRLWFGVTQNLIGGNVEEATNQKSKLEQKQRDDASARERTASPTTRSSSG